MVLGFSFKVQLIDGWMHMSSFMFMINQSNSSTIKNGTRASPSKIKLVSMSGYIYQRISFSVGKSTSSYSWCCWFCFSLQYNPSYICTILRVWAQQVGKGFPHYQDCSWPDWGWLGGGSWCWQFPWRCLHVHCALDLDMSTYPQFLNPPFLDELAGFFHRLLLPVFYFTVKTGSKPCFQLFSNWVGASLVHYHWIHHTIFICVNQLIWINRERKQIF